RSGSRRRVAALRLARMRTQAHVAALARGPGVGIAEVAQHERAATALGVRVHLHRVELRELGAPATIDDFPLDAEARERRGVIHETDAAAGAVPYHELPLLQLVEQRPHAAHAAEAGRQHVR